MTLDEMRQAMEAAAERLDFETARRLRDQISLMRAGGEAADTDGLTRQRPGAMGLGTSRQQVEPPKDWVKPKKPDPMTKGRKR